ncbi:MAG: tRNA glutamyl-Q(34) synthetase GluQRS [Clostridiales bacterium]|nr:tRNA glutamyl-Q(34) synthetase GluQRS [Clostridiales bacterium]
MKEEPVVGRFAPSPSGRMHLGNAFSALLAWLSVRSAGGRMILRLEDLDTARCKRAYCDQIEADYRWLGLDWDEGGSAGGPQYYQSSRSEYYRAALEVLEGQDLLYPCFCTRSELHAASAPHLSDGAALYAGTCRNLTAAEVAEKRRLRRPATRIRVPEREIAFRDGVMGAYREQLAEQCGDFILRRSDGIYAYQLAVVVDDALMGVNQVVRGRDLLSSTPRQLWLQERLGLPHPTYYHVPLLYGGDGHRLSKRQQDVDLGALRAAGVRPETLVGQLACWAGLLERPEPVAARELIPLFSWDKVGRTDILVPERVIDH